MKPERIETDEPDCEHYKYKGCIIVIRFNGSKTRRSIRALSRGAWLVIQKSKSSKWTLEENLEIAKKYIDENPESIVSKTVKRTLKKVL